MRQPLLRPVVAFMLAAATGWLTASDSMGAAVELARDGQARSSIVVSPEASDAIRAAANDLRDALSRMTGGDFAIIESGQARAGIVLGTLEQFPQPDDPSIAEALTIRDGYDGVEAFAIRTLEDRILLIGATDRGASHAAYRLLHELGCRWFFPNEAWTVIPTRATVSVDLRIDDRPAFLSRRIWYQWGFFDRGEGRTIREYNAWVRRNRGGASLRIHAGHAWDAMIARHRETFDQHPEYLALSRTVNEETGEVTEQRGGNKFCISNEDLQQLVADDVVATFDRQPDLEMVSVDPSDGGGHCECDACAAMGTVSDRVFHLANVAARAVQEKHPGKFIGLYAYNLHSEPPSFELEPNVYVQLTAGFIRGRYTYDELMELWPQKARHMGFYDYYSVYQWNWDMPPGGRGANVGYLRDSIRRYRAANGTSVDAESGNNWGLHGRGYVVASRLMWNPDDDVDAILADFHDKAFGPAAEPMRRYYDRLDPGTQPLMSEHLLGQALRDLEEATRLAQDHPDVLARLDHLKLYQHYVRLRWDLDRAGDDERKKALTLAALTHVYRSRYAYMNHWEAMRQFWIRRAADAFKEPTWSVGYDGVQPWRVDEPYASDEIAELFAQGLERFQPVAIEEVAFSDDLLPVVFDEGGRREINHRYQNAAEYWFHSRTGEPLTAEVRTGTIAWYRDRAPATWWFETPDGEALATGKLPLDGEFHAIEAQVPGPGLYRLRFSDSGAGWALRAGPEQLPTLDIQRARRYHHQGWMPDTFFYVPKGTTRLHYFWAGNPHNLFAPASAREAVHRTETSGAFVSVEVPEGQDGAVWRINQAAPGMIWFFNAPNLLAGSPGAMLLPRELIERDGLTVME